MSESVMQPIRPSETRARTCETLISWMAARAPNSCQGSAGSQEQPGKTPRQRSRSAPMIWTRYTRAIRTPLGFSAPRRSGATSMEETARGADSQRLPRPHCCCVAAMQSAARSNAEPSPRALFDAAPAPPPPVPRAELEARRTWCKKMVGRVRRGGPADVEAHYRRAWLLVDLLELYFVLRGKHFTGPKESLLWLAAHDEDAHQAFAAALVPGAPVEAIEALVSRVVDGEE